MTDLFFTKNQEWLDKWDQFLLQSDRAWYNQLSDWIKSYEVYGFDHEFMILVQNDTIIGGCGIVVAKFSLFKFLIVAAGPILELGYEHELERCLQELQKKAKELNCCYLQISVPSTKDNHCFSNYTLPPLHTTSNYFSGKEGVAFKYVIPLQGYRIVKLDNENPYETARSHYNSNNKRNLNKANKLELEFKFVTTDEDIKNAYQCFVLNAQEKGYPLRSYESMKTTLRKYIDKDYAKIGCCFYQNQIIGALYVMNCGQRLIYINGGVLKDFQTYNISNFMHDKMIHYSASINYKCYDLSVGGSKGVVQFKESFGSELYLFITTRHWILKSFHFKVFSIMERYLKPHKTRMAQLLMLLQKVKK
jgi:lipid II:glycine glycyltransferase (peptidoglycan interpeptide bridge formation enzyme)